MSRRRARDTWVCLLATVAALLVLGTLLLYRLVLGEAPGAALLTLAGAVVAGAIITIWRPRRAARHAWLFVMPASYAGWLWVSGAATPFTYVLTGSVGDPWP